MSKLPENPPYKGNPSFSICVYLPFNPCILTTLPLLPAAVVCTCIPVECVIKCAILLDSMLAASSISSVSTSVLVGKLVIVLLPLVDSIIISSISLLLDSREIT